MSAPLYRYDGEAKTLQEWADEHDLPVELVESRLGADWTLAEALQSPSYADGRGNGIEVPFAGIGGCVDIAEAAELSGIPVEVLIWRVVRGWDLRTVAKVRPLIGGAPC